MTHTTPTQVTDLKFKIRLTTAPDDPTRFIGTPNDLQRFRQAAELISRALPDYSDPDEVCALLILYMILAEADDRYLEDFFRTDPAYEDAWEFGKALRHAIAYSDNPDLFSFIITRE